MTDRVGKLRGRLSKPLARMWDQHREAYSRGDKLSSGVWGAVLVEALLEDILLCRGVNRGARLELASAIQALNGLKPDARLREIAQLADQIRLARNALVHPRVASDGQVDMNVELIAKALEGLLPLAIAELPVEADTTALVKAGLPEIIGRIFISSITPHSPLQQGFLDDVFGAMRAEGLEPVRIVTSAFDRNDPVAPVLAAMKTCDAVFCIGLSRAHAFLVRDKGQTEETHRHYTSGWMHLEVGMAYAIGLKVVTICESRIANDGAFDRHWNSSPPLVFSLDPPGADDPHVVACIEQLKSLALVRKNDPGITGV
jgi:hypothetical protein